MLRIPLTVLVLLVYLPAILNAQHIQSFIPSGHKMIDSAHGDFNSDQLRDFVLVTEPLTDSTEEYKRTLLILLSHDAGYKLAARTEDAVLCRQCGGMMGDPYQAMVVKNNFFSIELYGGSSWRWERIITFRYDKIKKQFLLHRDAGTSFHASDPDKIKKAVYHKDKWGKQLLKDFKADDW